MYHFLSGYTAKVAGTERGIEEPQATFSTCFGAAFMTLHPTVYADLLQKKLDKHGTHTYLVNSGWAGGPYGEGERMSIKTTRTCVEAILDGSIQEAEFKKDPVFGFDVPVALNGVILLFWIFEILGATLRSTISKPKNWPKCILTTSKSTKTRDRLTTPGSVHKPKLASSKVELFIYYLQVVYSRVTKSCRAI